jgi:hypothetical protein
MGVSASESANTAAARSNPIHRPHQRMLNELALAALRPQRPLQPLPLPPRRVGHLNRIRVTVDRRSETLRIRAEMLYRLQSRTPRPRMQACFPLNHAVSRRCHRQDPAR